MRTLLALSLAATLSAWAQTPQPGHAAIGYTDTPYLPDGKWRVHDLNRPRPHMVTPGVNGAPPSDAIVLLDGKDLSRWAGYQGGKQIEPGWKLENGYMEVVPGSGELMTKDKFGDIQLHIEWATPSKIEGESQDRGNSGVILMGKYEVQVLDSYDNVTYADGQAASMYGQYPPLVNASRKPGEWQTYDIFFEAPQFDNGTLKKPAVVTVIHNGILVQNHQAFIGTAEHRRVGRYTPHGAREALVLQNHGTSVRYRNIWLRNLAGYDQP